MIDIGESTSSRSYLHSHISLLAQMVNDLKVIVETYIHFDTKSHIMRA